MAIVPPSVSGPALLTGLGAGPFAIQEGRSPEKIKGLIQAFLAHGHGSLDERDAWGEVGHLAPLQDPSQQAWAGTRHPSGPAALAASSCHVGQFPSAPPSPSLLPLSICHLGGQLPPAAFLLLPWGLGALSDGHWVAGFPSLPATLRRALLSIHTCLEGSGTPSRDGGRVLPFSPLSRGGVFDYFLFHIKT